MIARTALLFGGELPAILATIGIDDGHRDSVLEAFSARVTSVRCAHGQAYETYR